LLLAVTSRKYFVMADIRTIGWRAEGIEFLIFSIKNYSNQQNSGNQIGFAEGAPTI
jgi:hypothetical protein